MWHSAQATFECGERACAVASGCITVWQACPQNSVDSITCTPL